MTASACLGCASLSYAQSPQDDSTVRQTFNADYFTDAFRGFAYAFPMAAGGALGRELIMYYSMGGNSPVKARMSGSSLNG